MRIIKKLLFLNIIISLLFFVTSCGKNNQPNYYRTDIEPGPNLVFCANAMYDSVEEVPNVVFLYSCYDEEFSENVYLYFRVGQVTRFREKKKNSKPIDINVEKIVDYDIKTHEYVIYVVDENNNKIGEFEKAIRSDKVNMYYGDSKNGLTIAQVYNKYVISCWFLSESLIIPMNYFDKEEGDIRLSVFLRDRESMEAESLVTVTIKYTNDGEKIKLIAPANSFSGKGLKEGKTLEEIFS